MAEVVEFRAEETVPELELLERLRIFTEAEIRNIIKTRRSFQYKIQRRTKRLEDFVRYIQYEMDLLLLVKSRGNKLGPELKRNKVEMMIASRVNKLFEQALFKFNNDINLWLSYMKFCKKIKAFRGSVSNMFVSMLAVHNHKPKLWMLAANWEFEENKSIENACQFIMRGLRHHPKSKLLYTEAFRLELICTDLQHKRLQLKANEIKEAKKLVVPSTSTCAPLPTCDVQESESGQVVSLVENVSVVDELQRQDKVHDPAVLSYDVSSDTILDCRNAEFVYASARQKISDDSFLIDLYKIANNFNFAEKLQSTIAKDLLAQFPSSELVWDVLARQELKGLLSRKNTEEEVIDKMDISDKPTACYIPRQRSKKATGLKIWKCYTIYQRGLCNVNTDKMWGLFLDTLIEINENPTIWNKVKQRLLLAAFQKAQNDNHLQEKHYTYWANMPGVDNVGIILLNGTEKCPSSVTLWEKRLQFYLLKNEDDNAMAVFKQAVSSMVSNAAPPIWKIFIQYWETKSVDVVQELFEERIKQVVDSSVLKRMYLEWLTSSKGIYAARAVYDRLCVQPPYCQEFHKKMVQLEGLQPKVNMSRITRCYELACEQFGKNNTDVWLEYVKFEATRSDPKKIKEIYQRALKTLDQDITHVFISNFCEYWVVKNLED